MNHDSYPDSYIRGILKTVKTIAMVGISPKDNRPSYFAFKYLLDRGYHMIPVNPGQAGKEILGQKVYRRLSEIHEPIDMVDIFRNSAEVQPVVEEEIDRGAEGGHGDSGEIAGVRRRLTTSLRGAGASPRLRMPTVGWR